MPKIKTKELDGAELRPQVPQFLEDGHPNPDFFPNNDRGFEEFQGVLDEKDLWNEYIGYLYRVTPKRAMTDKDARVCQFVHTLSIQEITAKYGGKKWSVWLNRGAGGHQRLAKKFQFDIEALPIWQDDETPADPPTANRAVREAAAMGTNPMLQKLIDDVIAQRDRALDQGQTFDTGVALQNALALQNEGFKSALTSVTANLGKGNDGGNAILVPLLNGMITMMGDLAKSVMARKEDPLLQTLLTRALEKPEDPFEKITGILTLLQTLGVKIGPGRATAEAGSEWAGVIEKAIDKAPEFLGNAVNLIAQGRAARATAGAYPTPPLPAITTSLTTPLAATASSPPVRNPSAPNPSAAPDVQQEEPGRADAVAISPELADRIAQNVVKAAIVRMLFNGDSGEDAAYYAAMAHEPLAKRLAEILKTNPAELQADPILAQAMTHVNVRTFAEEYIAYFEEKEEAPPAGVQPAGSEQPAPAA